MDGQSLDAAILQLLGKRSDDKVFLVPSEACLGGNRRVHGLYHGTRYLKHKRNVAQQARSCPLASHLLHGATKVKVNNVGMESLHYLSRLNHGINVLSIYLNTYGTFIIIDFHLRQSAWYRTYYGISCHKFRIHHSRTETLAQLTETYVSNVFHGCKKQ